MITVGKYGDVMVFRGSSATSTDLLATVGPSANYAGRIYTCFSLTEDGMARVGKEEGQSKLALYVDVQSEMLAALSAAAQMVLTREDFDGVLQVDKWGKARGVVIFAYFQALVSGGKRVRVEGFWDSGPYFGSIADDNPRTATGVMMEDLLPRTAYAAVRAYLEPEGLRVEQYWANLPEAVLQKVQSFLVDWEGEE